MYKIGPTIVVEQSTECVCGEVVRNTKMAMHARGCEPQQESMRRAEEIAAADDPDYEPYEE